MRPAIPSTYGDALRGITDPEFMRTTRYRSQQWRANRTGADPQILVFERLLVRRMGNLGVPMFASEVMRSAERQKALKAEGRSQLTNGPHMAGMAVDIVHGVKGWDMDKKAWALIGHVGKEIAAQEGLHLVWGGDWRFYDPAHWERRDWQNVPSPLHPV